MKPKGRKFDNRIFNKAYVKSTPMPQSSFSIIIIWLIHYLVEASFEVELKRLIFNITFGLSNASIEFAHILFAAEYVPVPRPCQAAERSPW